MALPDLTQYTDEEFEELSQAVLIEGERRRDIANIPGQIEALRARYVEQGGDAEDVTL